MKHKGGHHGGAWKVAYADFVTAMMALFLVLWLTAQDTRIKEAVERAFRNPFSSATKESTGILPNKDVQATHEQKGKYDSASAMEMELLRRVTEDLSKILQASPEDQNSVQLSMSPEGLCINVFDRSMRPIFEGNTIDFTKYGSWVFSTLAWEISRYRTFTVELEGHTESGMKPLKANYENWELSADRANASRRKLIEHGVSPIQICKVAGLADKQPMPQSDPKAEVNRRVTVLLKISPGTRIGASVTSDEVTPPPPAKP